MEEYYIKTPMNQYGPLKTQDAHKLIREGLSTSQDLVWDQDDSSWVQLENFDKFRPFFATIKKEKRAGKVVAFASGKGGVGKTALTSSMAIELGNCGKKVVVVDADFGGPDLHEWMGVPRPKVTLNSFFSYNNIDINQLVIDTSYKNVRLIGGEVGSIEFATPKYFKRKKFLKQLHSLDADFVFVDLSPGVSYQTIDIFLACDEGIVITVPETTSFMDAFNFIRSALIRKLLNTLSFSEYAVNKIKDFENWDWRKYDKPISSVLDKIENRDPRAAAIFSGVLEHFKPKMICNMVYSRSEARESSAFKDKLKQLLLIDVNYIGFIDFYTDMRRTNKDARPFVLSSPEMNTSPSAPQIHINLDRKRK